MNIKLFKFLWISSIIIILFSCASSQRFSDTWENEFLGSKIDIPFYPDGNANYWTYSFNPKNTNIAYKITGKIQKARYFSFNLYNDKTRASVASLIDKDIINQEGTYTIKLVSTEHKSETESKTLYFAPNSKSYSIFLRYYLPNDNPYGNVDLPNIIAYNIHTGKKIKLPKKRFNRLGAKNLFKALGKIASKKIDKSLFSNFNKNIIAYKRSGKGLYENKDNSYLIMPISKNKDEIAILKFKPPTFSKNFKDLNKEVRYWSLGLGDKKTFNYTTLCDKDLDINSDGYIYIAIGNKISTNQNIIFNQMSWVIKEKEALLIYRNLVPNPDFKYAVQNVPESNENAKKYINDYAPQGKVISITEFQKDGFKAIQ